MKQGLYSKQGKRYIRVSVKLDYVLSKTICEKFSQMVFFVFTYRKSFLCYTVYMTKEKNILKRTDTFFDKLEDKVRARLSRHPILYTFIGGFGIVLFWRGVWHTGDMLEAQGGALGYIFSGPGSIILSVVVLLMTGLFVSFFVGDVIILSGLKHEKKMAEKNEVELAKEEESIGRIEQDMLRLESKIEELEVILSRQNIHK